MNFTEKWFARGASAALFAVLAALSTTTPATAAPFTWDGSGNGANLNVWGAKQNWGNSGPPGAGDIANFNTVLAGNSITPSINANASISSIIFAATASSYTFGGTATLTVGSGGIANNSSALQVFNTAIALGAGQVWGGPGDITFGGPISGGGALTKNGNGTLTLNGANSFSGGLTVSGGRVLVNNTTGSGTGSGNILLNGGTIGGSGNITGGLTLNSGTKISAGQNSGTLRVGTLTTGSQTWNGGSSADVELKDATGTAGSGWDAVSINGSLALNATPLNQITINLSTLNAGNTAGSAANFDANGNYQWTFLETTGGITGFDASAFNVITTGFGNPLNGTSMFMISLVDGGNGLALTYVPEPSTLALGALGAVAIFGSCIRKRKK
jgi:autotransporter-associated beta strand protein